MRHLLLVLLSLILLTFRSSAQDTVKQGQPTSTPGNGAATYRLFPTQNMWNFIKLNTRTGQMWQVQFDIQGNNRSVIVLSSIFLVGKDGEADGRFTLYPAQNTYN